MDVRRRYCRFCGKEYAYHASGPYCHEPTNNENYCPRCMDIINKSLEKEVPEDDRYVRMIKETSEDNIKGWLGNNFKERMQSLKRPINKTEPLFPTITISVGLPYDNIDVYTISRRRIYVCKNNDDEVHYYVDKLCRKSNGEIVDDYDHYSKDAYSHGCNFLRAFTNAFANKTYHFDKGVDITENDLDWWEITSKTKSKTNN